eukprot:COSAG06_NODE_1593_length_8986_cov_6.740578_12_plen_265_part_00
MARVAPQQQGPAAAARRRSARDRKRPAPRTQYGAFSAADALAMRGEAPQVVAAARAAAADRNLAQRASRHSASVGVFAAIAAEVEAGEAAESAARADADWRPGGRKYRRLAATVASRYGTLALVILLAAATTATCSTATSAPAWPSELMMLAEGDFSDPRTLSIDGSTFVSGTDYRRLLRFDGDLTNASRTEFVTTVDFMLNGVNFGAEVWAWTPYQHTDGSWHAYYTADAFEIMYAQPDPPTQRWSASSPILKVRKRVFFCAI